MCQCEVQLSKIGLAIEKQKLNSSEPNWKTITNCFKPELKSSNILAVGTVAQTILQSTIALPADGYRRKKNGLFLINFLRTTM